MGALNFHHLMQFRAVAQAGGLAAAGARLRVTPSTLSAQVRQLESALGERLFDRTRRRLILTEHGRILLRYADEIASLGDELQVAMRGGPSGKPIRLHVGVVDSVPKQVVRQLLAPALEMTPPVLLTCTEDTHERLLGDLASHTLDLVIADAPLTPGSATRAFHHVLGESTVSLFVGTALARKLRRGFPRSLDGAPVLLPLPGQPLRRQLDAWFLAQGIRPRVLGEFEDSALLNAFVTDGGGVFAAPDAIAPVLARQYDVSRLGVLPGAHERFFAITVERRITHPAVQVICAAAPRMLAGMTTRGGPARRRR